MIVTKVNGVHSREKEVMGVQNLDEVMKMLLELTNSQEQQLNMQEDIIVIVQLI